MEPSAAEIHLYELRDDGKWYYKGDDRTTDDKVERIEELERENRRMITAFEALSSIVNDMLDPVRRAGPGRPPIDKDR